MIVCLPYAGLFFSLFCVVHDSLKLILYCRLGSNEELNVVLALLYQYGIGLENVKYSFNTVKDRDS